MTNTKRQLVNEGTCHPPSTFFTPAQPVPFGPGSETMGVNLPVEFAITIGGLCSEDRHQLQAELLGKRGEALNIHQCAEASIGASIYTSLKSTTGPERKANSSGCRLQSIEKKTQACEWMTLKRKGPKFGRW